MVMSGRWPVAIHGSLVITQSPARHCSFGERASRCLRVRGRIPTNDGMPAVFSDSESPLASIRTVAKSLDSRTIVENDVRSSAAADSSAIEISRLHRISSVTGSNSVRDATAICPPDAISSIPGGSRTRLTYLRADILIGGGDAREHRDPRRQRAEPRRRAHTGLVPGSLLRRPPARLHGPGDRPRPVRPNRRAGPRKHLRPGRLWPRPSGDRRVAAARTDQPGPPTPGRLRLSVGDADHVGAQGFAPSRPGGRKALRPYHGGQG